MSNSLEPVFQCYKSGFDELDSPKGDSHFSEQIFQFCPDPSLTVQVRPSRGRSDTGADILHQCTDKNKTMWNEGVDHLLSFNRFLLNLAQITRKGDSNLDAINCIKQHAINLSYCTTKILFHSSQICFVTILLRHKFHSSQICSSPVWP